MAVLVWDRVRGVDHLDMAKIGSITMFQHEHATRDAVAQSSLERFRDPTRCLSRPKHKDPVVLAEVQRQSRYLNRVAFYP
jgi:hypothetical protein